VINRLPTKRMVAVVAVVAAGLVLTGCPPSVAPDPSKGYAGRCTGADALSGTTIVVDFQELNGLNGAAAPDIVRCSPNRSGAARTGVRALQDAGIGFTGVTRWGLGFVCRISGRPSGSEPLPISGNPTYRESCENTPPTSAYWGYWFANGAGTTWSYSASGAGSRNVIPGGFEGWSFALNKSPATRPPPGFTPRNPAVP
jgi:hypothetical protein